MLRLTTILSACLLASLATGCTREGESALLECDAFEEALGSPGEVLAGWLPASIRRPPQTVVTQLPP